jgi:protocatechuate 3,4-dioxygenase beta subunit
MCQKSFLVVALSALFATQACAHPAQASSSTTRATPKENVQPTEAKEDNARDAVTFTGRVLDPDGRLLADAKLHLIVQSWRQKLPQVRTTSGSDGAF